MDKIATADELVAELRNILEYVESRDGYPSRGAVVAQLDRLKERLGAVIPAPVPEGQPGFPFSRNSKPWKALELVLETLSLYRAGLASTGADPKFVSQVRYAEEQISKGKTALFTLENQYHRLFGR